MVSIFTPLCLAAIVSIILILLYFIKLLLHYVVQDEYEHWYCLQYLIQLPYDPSIVLFPHLFLCPVTKVNTLSGHAGVCLV